MGAHPAPGLGPAEGVHSPGCPPPNAPRSSAMPADSLEHANNNHTKKGQTGLETGRSAGGLVQNVRKPSHEWGEPLPIQAASPIGEVGARQLSPPSITSTLSALQEFTAPRRQSHTVGSREASLRGPTWSGNQKGSPRPARGLVELLRQRSAASGRSSDAADASIGAMYPSGWRLGGSPCCRCRELRAPAALFRSLVQS